MSVRPRLHDYLVVGKYTGKVIVGVGLLMVVPFMIAALFAEWDTALDFVISMMTCFVFGFGAQYACRTSKEISWRTGLVIASGSWVWATLIGALPHWLSGHQGSYLDAMFDTMSGLTTTGLYLIQDLDHVSNGLNMWRHVLTYAGGQGIIVIALTFLFKGTKGVHMVYVGEGREERLLPNVIHSARAIWLISLAHLCVGTIVLWSVALLLGQRPVRALLHSAWVFMGAWSTGGFAPTSYNTMWYHSPLFEAVTIVVFVAGSLNFALHWAVWTGRRREIVRNIETLSFAVTLMLLISTLTFWFARAGLYPDAMALGRKVIYQLASGHTTTGFSTIYSRAFVTQWGTLGLLITAVAMAIGASACSTGGGIKGLRVGIVFKALLAEVRRTTVPRSAMVREKYHHIRDVRLDDGTVRAATMITLLFVGMHVVLTMVGVMHGYPLAEALFEGVSAGSNTGLSCGVVDPSMPSLMKALYIVAMWLGRLEFVSVFALAGYGISIVRGR